MKLIKIIKNTVCIILSLLLFLSFVGCSNLNNEDKNDNEKNLLFGYANYLFKWKAVKSEYDLSDNQEVEIELFLGTTGIDNIEDFGKIKNMIILDMLDRTDSKVAKLENIDIKTSPDIEILIDEVDRFCFWNILQTSWNPPTEPVKEAKSLRTYEIPERMFTAKDGEEGTIYLRWISLRSNEFFNDTNEVQRPYKYVYEYCVKTINYVKNGNILTLIDRNIECSDIHNVH